MEFKKTIIEITLYGKKISIPKPTITAQMAFEKELAEATKEAEKGNSSAFILNAEKHLVIAGFTIEDLKELEAEHFVEIVNLIFTAQKKT